MDAYTTTKASNVAFKSSKKFLSDLGPDVTASVLASASDVALILEKGVIKDIAINSADLILENYGESWCGKKWVETVTIESRPKIDALLTASSAKSGVWRQVNHPSSDGLSVPIKYTAIPLIDKERIVVIGRDLRALAELQQKLVLAHQGLERDYDRLREAEARYRLLFLTISEAVCIIDANTNKIDDINPAGTKMFHESAANLIGSAFKGQFLKKHHREIEQAFSNALASGSLVSDMMKLKGGKHCRISVSPFRYEDDVRLIVKLILPEHEDNMSAVENTDLRRIMEDLPDALVITDNNYRILEANRSFSRMLRLSSTSQVISRRLDDFVGRSSTDLNVLASNIKRYGSVRNFSTIIRDQFGAEERVELSAVEAQTDNGGIFGFSIRNIARHLESGSGLGQQLPKSVDQLTELVGKISLKDIVRESSDLIEKLCIEAALEITDDNRASAAELLGLSRQGLYSKLKRFDKD